MNRRVETRVAALLSEHTITVLLVILHLGSIFAAIDALSCARTSQGAIAWVLSLVLFPHLMLPAYLIFGRKKFYGYRRLTERMSAHRTELVRVHRAHVRDLAGDGSAQLSPQAETMERIVEARFLAHNQVELLLEGREYFNAVLRDIRAAQSLVCLCFYIVRDDTLGRELQDALVAARARGVRVCFLYDEIGSFRLPEAYVATLEAAGVEIHDFNTRRGLWNFFQVNFRNHRKLVIVDRTVAYVGGANIGDEYLGLSPRFGFWRDTQLRLHGPVVRELENVFLADWNWATQGTETLPWLAPIHAGSEEVLTAPTGPIDERESCLLLFQELVRSAQRRLWIASPYFVPDEAILQELKLAALRGVDVRVMIPAKPDRITVGLAALFYLPPLVHDGIRAYRYTKGFMHQKVVVVDEECAAIGSANFDNRSMRLAFEVTLVIRGREFTEQVANMYERDLRDCEQLQESSLAALPFHVRLGANIARLFSSLL